MIQNDTRMDPEVAVTAVVSEETGCGSLAVAASTASAAVRSREKQKQS